MCQCKHSKPPTLTLKSRAPVNVLAFFLLFTHEISNIWWQFKNVILKLNKICYVFVDGMDIAQEFFFISSLINPAVVLWKIRIAEYLWHEHNGTYVIAIHIQFYLV